MDDPNPYAAPREMGVDEPVIHGPLAEPNPIASADERLVTLLIDVAPFAFLFLFLVSLVGEDFTGLVICASITAMLLVLYYYFLERKFGRTLGKLHTGTRVFTRDGQDPSADQILKRTLARLIPFDILFFLGERGHPIGLHDSLSGTVVVALKRWKGRCTWLEEVAAESFTLTASTRPRDISPFATSQQPGFAEQHSNEG